MALTRQDTVDGLVRVPLTNRTDPEKIQPNTRQSYQVRCLREYQNAQCALKEPLYTCTRNGQALQLLESYRMSLIPNRVFKQNMHIFL